MSSENILKYPFRKTVHYSSLNHLYHLVSFILWVSVKSATLSLGHFLAFSYSFPHEPNFLLFFFFFLNFWLCWVFVVAPGLSLVAVSWGYCLVVVCAHLIVVSLVEHRLLGAWASVFVTHGSSCPVACGILPNQGQNLCPLHWQADSQPLDHQGGPSFLLICRS